jgi:hypothetical protein
MELIINSIKISLPNQSNNVIRKYVDNFWTENSLSTSLMKYKTLTKKDCQIVFFVKLC